MVDVSKRLRLVGEFIRKRRETLGMSQRALGLMFDPPVTTQFISNVERGVTPLPPIHIPVLAKSLSISDSEITLLLEKEYAMKLSGRLGRTEEMASPSGDFMPSLTIANSDFEFMKNLYQAYRLADMRTKETFADVCETMLKVSKSGSQQHQP